MNDKWIELLEFLEKYNKHFTDVVMFLNMKQQKVLADDVIWLHDSLQQEQKFVMAGVSLEKRRLELLAAMGYPDYPSSKLSEVMPEEYGGRFRLECTNMEKSIDRIKAINAEILETIEKKLEVADEILGEQGVSTPGFYDVGGGKVRLGDPENDIIGSM
jgi:hypothetical protein